jgi:hypothetical protein
MLRKTRQNIPVAKPYLLATAIAVLIFLPTWVRLAEAWLEFEQVFAHGLASALIFLWLVITHPPASNKALTHQQRPFYKTGALALIVIILGWAVLELARIDTLAYFAVPAGIAGVTWAVLAWQRLISSLPYILILSLSLPFWAEMQSDLLTDHELMGWLVYGAFIIPVMYFSTVMKRNPDSQAQPAKLIKKGDIAIAVAVLLGPAALALATTTQPGLWSLNMANGSKAELQALPIPLSMPEALSQQAWRTAGTRVFAQSQRTSADDKLVPYLPSQFDRSQWLRESNQQPGATVYRNILTREQVVMAQWYQAGDYRADSYRNAKLLQIPALLQGATRFALVTLQASCQQRSCENAYNAVINQKKTLQGQSFTLTNDRFQ